MISVKTIKDIRKVRQSKSEEFSDHIENQFKQMWQALGDGGLETFSLENHGYMVILEEKDDLYALEEIGLNQEDKGLIGSTPEWVKIKRLRDGRVYYEIALLFNNDYLMLLYIAKETIRNDKTIQTWLATNQ